MITIRLYHEADHMVWDAYVHVHPKATLYHLSGWKNIIEKTYAHKTYYLIAVNSSKLKVEDPPYSWRTQSSKNNSKTNYQLSAIRKDTASAYELTANSYELNSNNVVGILPLVHLKHFLFGNSLISIPFFDTGGILADNEETEKALLFEAIKLAQDLNLNNIELRHTEPLPWLGNSSQLKAQSSKEKPEDYELSTMSHELPSISYQLSAISCLVRSHKARMLLKLPESSEILMKSFKSKLRSQIKKPIKEGLKAKIGSLELLDDFYKVFLINMRDLGSPVHSKKIIRSVIEEFPDKSRIVMIYKAGQPVACSIIVGFKETLENPWASALKQYSRLSPNMLLYWSMLEYACDNSYKYFDLGRSTPDEGTYKFKEQWGAKPNPLHWHYISLNGQPIIEETSEKSKFDKAIHYWQKLPVSVTKILGPMVRKHIGL